MEGRCRTLREGKRTVERFYKLWEKGMKEPEPMSVWKHTKGGIYVVTGVATCSTNGPRDGNERTVIYHSLEMKGLRARELSEFMDGRFTQVTVTGMPLGRVFDAIATLIGEEHDQRDNTTGPAARAARDASLKDLAPHERAMARYIVEHMLYGYESAARERIAGDLLTH